MKIKEKVLKGYKFGSSPQDIAMKVDMMTAIDLTLAEVGKVIDDWMKNKVRKCGNLFCMEDGDRIIRTDRYVNIIELLVEQELKQKLGIK